MDADKAVGRKQKEGTDTHALHAGAIAVTPIRAAFEPAKAPEYKWRL